MKKKCRVFFKDSCCVQSMVIVLHAGTCKSVVYAYYWIITSLSYRTVCNTIIATAPHNKCYNFNDKNIKHIFHVPAVLVGEIEVAEGLGVSINVYHRTE